MKKFDKEEHRPISEWDHLDIEVHLCNFRLVFIILLLALGISFIPIPFVSTILRIVSGLGLLLLLSGFLLYIIIVADKKLPTITDSGANTIFTIMLLIFFFASIYHVCNLFNQFFDFYFS